jgi:hypothetical protein
MPGSAGQRVFNDECDAARVTRARRLPAPVRGDGTTISGDGWTFKAAAGRVIREGGRRGDYEVVRQQP